MRIPSENDVIIPDPCFDLRDIMDFKLISPSSSTSTVDASQPVSDQQFDSIKKYFSPSLSCLDVFSNRFKLLLEAFFKSVERSSKRKHCFGGYSHFTTTNSAHSLLLHGSC